jgi:hypothetical protein
MPNGARVALSHEHPQALVRAATVGRPYRDSVIIKFCDGKCDYLANNYMQQNIFRVRSSFERTKNGNFGVIGPLLF